MALAYEEMFLLSLFSDQQAKKETSIYYILLGKRTASMLYRAIDYALEPVFGFSPKLNRVVYQQRLDALIKAGFVRFAEETKEGLLTPTGKEVLNDYFSQHYQPTYLNWLTEGRTVLVFQKVVYFLAQILSEIRYNNKRYIPIEKNAAVQHWVKKWLSNQDLNFQDIGIQFGSEWKELLSQIEPDNAAVIVHLMTGHDRIGFTKAQLAQKMEQDKTEVHMRLLDSLSFIAQLITKKPEKTPLLTSIWSEIARKNNHGLSQSAQDTQRLLQQHYSIEQICSIRRLKKSTISEHIIELAIVDPNLNIAAFIPKKSFLQLQHLFAENGALTYQEAAEKIPEMEFYWFRLMQIERRRDYGKHH